MILYHASSTYHEIFIYLLSNSIRYDYIIKYSILEEKNKYGILIDLRIYIMNVIRDR